MSFHCQEPQYLIRTSVFRYIITTNTTPSPSPSSLTKSATLTSYWSSLTTIILLAKFLIVIQHHVTRANQNLFANKRNEIDKKWQELTADHTNGGCCTTSWISTTRWPTTPASSSTWAISTTPRSQWSRPTVSPAGAACSQWIGRCGAHVWSHPPADHRCGEFVVMIMRMIMRIMVVGIQRQLGFYREIFSVSLFSLFNHNSLGTWGGWRLAGNSAK